MPVHNEAGTTSRPDVIAHGEDGEEYVFEVSVIPQPSESSSKFGAAQRDPATPLRDVAAMKYHQHEDYIKQRKGKATFVPVIANATGGWLLETHDYLNRLSQSIAQRTQQPLHVVRESMFQEAAQILVHSNAHALTADLPDSHLRD